VVGDVRVGKSTALWKACGGEISEKIVPTIGVQFKSMSLEHKSR